MKAKYPNEYSHSDFIRAIYLNLFKRVPDSSGADYWREALESSSMSRSLFILAVMNGALGADRDILEYKTQVGVAYASDGRDDIDDALAMMREITADKKSVDTVLCKFGLPGCSTEVTIDKEEIVENSSYIGGNNSGGALVTPSKPNPTIDTSNFAVNDFGTKYTTQIPANATKSKYDEKRFALVKGEVVDADGNPLEGVEVSLLHHSEYGSQQSSSSGNYAIAVEGGVSMSVRYTKKGYSTIDRKVSVKSSDWTIVPRVTLLQVDTKVTKIDLHRNRNRNQIQTHTSTRISDSRGTRATLLVFNDRVTKATVVSKDGTQRELSSIDVRATEFTTPDSMPASLPANSAFTYCADIKVDGVGDDEWVEFDSPVMMYVDNFLGFDVGEVVPVGYYDRVDGEWKCSDNGVVVQLLDRSCDGKVDALDSTGDGQANDLNGNGAFDDEVEGIKDNPSYTVGNSYQRVAISHFTPWDHNWPWGPEGDGTPPEDPDTKPDDNPPLPNDCRIEGQSYITMKSRVFHEDIPLAGTSKALHYASNRVDGYQYLISTTVDMTNSPASAINAEVRVEVAGRTLIEEATLGEKNKITFKWDGKDALGYRVQGAVDAKVKAVYYYKLVYYGATDEFKKAWAKSGTRATDVIARDKIGLTSENIISLTPQTPPQSSKLSNGWSISSHKEALDDAVVTGSGDIIYPQENAVGMIRRVAGESSGYNGDDINASEALLDTPTDMSIDADGNILFVDSKNYRVRKIDTNGVITTIAGDGSSNSLNPKALTVDDSKNIYIADGTTIKKIDIDGNSKTLIGGGSTLVPINGGVLKNDAKLLSTKPK